MVFLQEVFFISLYLFAAFITATPSPNLDFDDSHLPSIRFSREEVQAMKEAQAYPPGYIHDYITFGNGSDATSVPLIEPDYDIFLSDEDGIRARSLAPRGGCVSAPSRAGSCEVNYCWNYRDHYYSGYLTLRGGGLESNPRDIRVSNHYDLDLNRELNNGYKHWFPENQDCTNAGGATIYTKHLLVSSHPRDRYGVAHISRLYCNTCEFSRLDCQDEELKNNLVAFKYTPGGQPGQRIRCT
jgi:hypothetical protein